MLDGFNMRSRHKNGNTRCNNKSVFMLTGRCALIFTLNVTENITFQSLARNYIS